LHIFLFYFEFVNFSIHRFYFFSFSFNLFFSHSNQIFKCCDFWSDFGGHFEIVATIFGKKIEAVKDKLLNMLDPGSQIELEEALASFVDVNPLDLAKLVIIHIAA